MAIDQTPVPSPAETLTSPAIENEFPTYRAISSLAVASLILGLASVFSFANLWFLLLTGSAILSGWLALRKISKFPEILTGASLARVGIGVGMLFGLSAITHQVVEEITTSLDAGSFVNNYIGVIKEKPVSMALWYQESVEYRAKNSPDELVEELKKSKSPTTPDPYGAKANPILAIKKRLESKGQVLRFSKIEQKVIDGLTLYVNALLEIDGPVTTEYPKKEFALVRMIKSPGAGKFDWVIKDFVFPYTPESARIEMEHKDDDGHGH